MGVKLVGMIGVYYLFLCTFSVALRHIASIIPLLLYGLCIAFVRQTCISILFCVIYVYYVVQFHEQKLSLRTSSSVVC